MIDNISRKNPKDRHGWTPLHSAAQNGHLRVCKLILSNILESKEYSMNFIRNPSGNHGNNPFYLSTQFCQEQVKTAIQESIIFNPPDNFGNNPFNLATQFCHEQVKTAIQEFVLDAKERKTGHSQPSTFKPLHEI
jgi:ankyrin repeat protein